MSVHIRCNLHGASKRCRQSSLHCGIAETTQKSSRFHTRCMTRQSTVWISSSASSSSFLLNCAAGVSSRFLRERLLSSVITATEAPTQSLLLQESESLGAGALLCLGTLCVSVSVASGAQSQVKYPPPTVQSVRGACPPRPLSL